MNFLKFFLIFFLVLILFSLSSFAIQVCSFEDAINFCGQFSDDQASCTSQIDSANFGCSWLSDNSCIPTVWTQTVDDRCICVLDQGTFEIDSGDVCNPNLPTTNYCGNGIINQGESCDLVADSGDSGLCLTSPSGNICNSADCSCWSFCGDGVYQSNNDEGTSEECDESSFPNSNSCVTFNSEFTSGSLRCRTDCTIDSSACVIELPPEPIVNITPPFVPIFNETNSTQMIANLTDLNFTESNSTCGDGIFESDIEGCELALHCADGFTCESCTCVELQVVQEPEPEPVVIPPNCGNFALDAGEQCDGYPNQGSYAWACTPIEVCTSDCVCTSADLACGNGVLDGGEYCDISASNGNSCSAGLICSGRCFCIAVQETEGGLPELRFGEETGSLRSIPAVNNLGLDASATSIDSPDAIRADSSGKSLFAAIALVLVGIIAILLLFFHFHGVKKTPVSTAPAEIQTPPQNP